jgi:tetraacyldisaccharide 4'-kinase
VLEDGFQHMPIARDIDVVLMSPGVGVMSRDSLCLPAGNLREPLEALKRATHLVTVVGRDSRGDIATARGELARVRYGDLMLMNGVDAQGKSLATTGIPVRPLVACGIARPAPFLEALAARGIVPANVLLVPDHASFDPMELQRVVSRDIVGASVACDAIITTAKDFWRDPQILLQLGVPVWVLPMSIEFPYHKLISAG